MLIPRPKFHTTNMFVPQQSPALAGGILTPMKPEIITQCGDAVPSSTEYSGLPLLPVDAKVPASTVEEVHAGPESDSSADGTTTSRSHTESTGLSSSHWQQEDELSGNDEVPKHLRHTSIESKTSLDWSEQKEDVWFPTFISARAILISTAQRLFEDLTTTFYRWEARPSADRSCSH
jgi:hypothetical protein